MNKVEAAAIKIQGVGRMADNGRALLVMISRTPSDDELRSIHDRFRAALTTQSPSDALQTALIDERDAAEECVSNIYCAVTGRSPEWSNIFGHANALEEITDAVNALKLAAQAGLVAALPGADARERAPEILGAAVEMVATWLETGGDRLNDDEFRLAETIATALTAAEQRGMMRAAEIADSWKVETLWDAPKREIYNGTCDVIAEAIRVEAGKC